MKRLIAVMLCTMVSFTCLAQVSVIVHPSNSASLDDSAIKRLFLGKMKSFPGGGEATPFSLKDGSAGATAFNSAALGKSDSQLKGYWSKLIFTGKGTPPKELADDAAMLSTVAGDASAIGYISGPANDQVKVVATY